MSSETKKERYIYYHRTFDKGACSGHYVREKEVERQFEMVFDGFRFSEVIVDYVREALRQGRKEEVKFHQRAIRKLRAQYEKLGNRVNQIHLDKLDGENEDTFYHRRQNYRSIPSDAGGIRHLRSCVTKVFHSY